MHRKNYRIHFIGIGGSGMSGIAEILLQLKYTVTGSDIKDSAITRRLRQMGAVVHIGHREANIGEIDAAVYSSAIDRDNPEIRTVRQRRIPLIHRSEMLFELMRLKRGIAVAGTHGKTTTTSILGLILTAAGLDPTVVVGGLVHSIGTSARLGRGELMVVEADESDGSFMRFNPEIAIVTNIDNDHLDHYSSMDNIIRVFRDFIDRLPFYGFGIICGDDPHIRALLPDIRKKVITYGLDNPAARQGRVPGPGAGPDVDLRAEEISEDATGSGFTVVRRGVRIGRLTMPVPGRQYILNSLAAAGVALELGVEFPVIERSIREYNGVGRRFQLAGEARGIKVIDDYGHHPTEIRCTAASARGLKPRRLIGIFQPHRFSRTFHLHRDFARVLEESFDRVILTDIYPAAEINTYGVSTEWIRREFRDKNKITVIDDFKRICDELGRVAGAGDIVLCMGAGSISRLPAMVVEALAAGETEDL